jgi:hypothetical protein
MSIQLKLQVADFVIDVLVGDKREKIDIRTAMSINNEDLVSEYTQQPSWYAWYASLLADQEDKKERIGRERDVYKSKIDMEIRQGKRKILDDEGKQIKLTEGGIQNYTASDEKMQAYEDEIQEQEYICNKLKVLVMASVQRKDMLIQLGLLKRDELKQFRMAEGQN